MKNILLYLWNGISAIAVFASIFSFIALAINHRLALIILLGWFCLAMLVIVLMIAFILSKYVSNNYPKPWELTFLYVLYTSDDGIFITYEIFSHVQCKRLMETTFEQKFKWTGNVYPTISSKLQTIDSHIKSTDKTKLDGVILGLKEPLTVSFQPNLD